MSTISGSHHPSQKSPCLKFSQEQNDTVWEDQMPKGLRVSYAMFSNRKHHSLLITKTLLIRFNPKSSTFSVVLLKSNHKNSYAVKKEV